MTLSFTQLSQFLAFLVGRNQQKATRVQKLDLKSLSDDMIRDLNLPPEIKGKFEADCEAEKFRRRHFI